MPLPDPTLPGANHHPMVASPHHPAVSPLQASLLLRALSQPGGPAPVKQAVLVLSHPASLAAVQEAMTRLVADLPGLASAFSWADAGPRLDPPASPDLTLALQEVDLTRGLELDGDADWEAFLQRDAAESLDPFQAPLWRLAWVRRHHHHALVFRVHEALLDDDSAVWVVAELGRRLEGRTHPVPRNPASTPTVDLPRAAAAWGTYLVECPAITPLPLAVAAAATGSGRGTSLATLRLPADVAHALRAVSLQSQASLRTVLEAFWAVLLHRCTGADDVLFAVARPAPSDASRVPGQHLHLSAVRAALHPTLPFGDWVRSLEAARMPVEPHDHAGLDQIRAWSGLPPGGSGFEQLLHVRALGQSPAGEPPVMVRRHGGVPLLAVVTEEPEGLSLELSGETARYPAGRLTHLLQLWASLLRSIAQHPQTAVAHLEWFTPGQLEAALQQASGRVRTLPATALVTQLVLEQAALHPEAVAVQAGSQSITYRDLIRRATRLAHLLQERGVQPGHAVPLCCGRSIDMTVGVLGILLTGAAYAPLDPAYPRERLEGMVSDLKPRATVTQRALTDRLPSGTGARVFLEDLATGTTSEPPGPPYFSAAQALAYVIFTSGSTGRPKGVAMGHRPLVNLLAWQQSTLPLGPSDRTLQFASLSFDVSFQELFSTWSGGGTIVLITEEQRRDPGALWKLITDAGITRVYLPFIALQQLAEAAEADPATTPTALREIITAGEQLQVTPALRALFRRVPGARLHNHYGPSETHVVTALTLTGAPDAWPDLPSIGRPIDNTLAVILDPVGRPVPEYVPGELHLGGACLAQGYFGRPELTAERFVERPLGASRSLERLYRTGDLGRRMPGGDIEFLGRADGQVKIRGHRVEVGEVEAALGGISGVRACAVVAQLHRGEQRLVGYYVPAAPGQPDPAQVREALQGRLPDAMVPAVLVPLDALPVTPSGKIHRRALPDPSTLAAPAPRPAARLTETERALAGLWTEVLGVTDLAPQDNFFALGGSSLKVVQVHRLIRTRLGREISVAQLFQQPTLAGLARELDAAEGQSEALQAVVHQRAARQRQVRPAPRRPQLRLD